MVESSTFSMIVKGRYFGSFPEVTFKNHNDLHYFLLKLTERQVDFSNRWFIIQQVFLWKYRSRAFFKIYYTAAHLAAALEGQTFDFHFRFLKGPQSACFRIDMWKFTFVEQNLKSRVFFELELTFTSSSYLASPNIFKIKHQTAT